MKHARQRLLLHLPSKAFSDSFQCGDLIRSCLTSLFQVLEEKPTNAVDLQELSLLAKKTAFDGKESSPLLPVPVSTPKISSSATFVGPFVGPSQHRNEAGHTVAARMCSS